jgi:hypothetical protein
MGTLASEISRDLLELPSKVRAELAHKLIRSLDTKKDLDAKELWDREIAKRSAEIAKGKVRCRPVNQVISDIRRKLGNADRKPSRR